MHEVAQAIDPTARIVYVDNAPIVLAHARRLLSTAPGGSTAYVHADLRYPEAILDHPDLRATLDLDQPVALLLIAVLHFIPDADDPHGLVATLTDALATGSHLAISNVTLDFLSPEMKAKIETFNAQEHDQTRDPSAPRDRAAFARFFDGMRLIPPGITPICDWRNDTHPASANRSRKSASTGPSPASTDLTPARPAVGRRMRRLGAPPRLLWSCRGDDGLVRMEAAE